MLILDDDTCWASTNDVDASCDISDNANGANKALLSDEDVDAMEAESTTRKKSRTKKEGAKAKDNQIAMELGYNRWMRRDIWLAGKECLAKDNVKQ